MQGIDHADHSINIDTISLVSDHADHNTAVIYLKQSVNGDAISIHTLDSHDEIMTAA